MTTILGSSNSSLEPGESTDGIHGSPYAPLTAEANPSDDVAMEENSTVASQPEDDGRSCSRSSDTMAMDSSTEHVQGTCIIS